MVRGSEISWRSSDRCHGSVLPQIFERPSRVLVRHPHSVFGMHSAVAHYVSILEYVRMMGRTGTQHHGSAEVSNILIQVYAHPPAFLMPREDKTTQGFMPR